MFEQVESVLAGLTTTPYHVAEYSAVQATGKNDLYQTNRNHENTRMETNGDFKESTTDLKEEINTRLNGTDTL